jgi:SAM-dependent methyltransferase
LRRTEQIMASADQIRSSHDARKTPAHIVRDAARAIPRCPLCASIQTERAFTDAGCALHVCLVCELFFTHPYPESRIQHEMVHTGEYSEIEILDCERRYRGERLYYDRHYPFIEEECAGAASLLDVGCGTGHLLERLGMCPGLQRAGIELNSQAAQFARRVSACEVFAIPFEEFQAEQQFDVITMINVLSHIPSFDGMFRSLRAALRPGGKVILRTSEMSPRVSRWNQLHWGIPDDLHFLGLRTLDFLCAKYGFAVARHVRTPFEEELFRPSRWQQAGRSRFVNLVKAAGVRVPGVLPAMRSLYTAALGRRLFVSFIVLTPIADGRSHS